LALADKNYENLVKGLTNNAIDTAFASSYSSLSYAFPNPP